MNRPNETIAYVTRDIERALGIQPGGSYYIITNRTPYAETIQKQHPEHVILIESSTGESLGTGDLLKHEKALEFLAAHRDPAGGAPYLIVFKNTARIEPIAQEQGWNLLNPPASLAEKIENKVSQIAWLGEAGKHLPSHYIDLAKNLKWNGEPFIIQWAHGHTGGGTMLLRTEGDLSLLQQKFPERRARVSAFVNGPSFTVNVIAGTDSILAANVNYQITGMAPFTANAFSTVGNDWKLAQMLLSDDDMETTLSLIQEIGAKMRADSWRGLFGIDFIKDAANGRIHLIEINARQPASATYESHLQEERRSQGSTGMTTFEAHLAALLRQPLSEPIIKIADGAQIVQRLTPSIKSISDEILGSLELSGYETMAYPNTDENADLARIQSQTGIMADHNAFNRSGEEIRDAVSQAQE